MIRRHYVTAPCVGLRIWGLCAKYHKVARGQPLAAMEPSMAKQDDPDKDNSDWARLATMGMEVAVGVVLGTVVGNWLDKKYHWDPWGTIIGAAVGFLSGIYLLAKEALGLNRDGKKRFETRNSNDESNSKSE